MSVAENTGKLKSRLSEQLAFTENGLQALALMPRVLLTSSEIVVKTKQN